MRPVCARSRKRRSRNRRRACGRPVLLPVPQAILASQRTLCEAALFCVPDSSVAISEHDATVPDVCLCRSPLRRYTAAHCEYAPLNTIAVLGDRAQDARATHARVPALLPRRRAITPQRRLSRSTLIGLEWKSRQGRNFYYGVTRLAAAGEVCMRSPFPGKSSRVLSSVEILSVWRRQKGG
jgi:hypothetical protein